MPEGTKAPVRGKWETSELENKLEKMFPIENEKIDEKMSKMYQNRQNCVLKFVFRFKIVSRDRGGDVATIALFVKTGPRYIFTLDFRQILIQI